MRGIENSPVTSPAPTSAGFGFPGAGSSRRVITRLFTSIARLFTSAACLRLTA
ncbi:hypothetical protein [Streptomyces sp. SCL15-4]|uniref:hypothetical protein n=1 Tax=Streptomyces sp. SCL15-4 TaxID=2967221 RepID=UPI0029666797|nr:hypothetical protein [Streptomyces sp. SCL15-4]